MDMLRSIQVNQTEIANRLERLEHMHIEAKEGPMSTTAPDKLGQHQELQPSIHARGSRQLSNRRGTVAASAFRS